MATIEDLGYKSISDMTTDEAIEHLRQIRLSRRTPIKKTSSKKTTAKASKAIPKMSADQAKKLLELIGGEK